MFLAAHWDGLMAADFFTAEVVTVRGLVRHTVFFVMELKTRRVQIAGITSSPNERWMLQMARNLTDAADGFLLGKTLLILGCSSIQDLGSAAHGRRTGPAGQMSFRPPFGPIEVRPLRDGSS